MATTSVVSGQIVSGISIPATGAYIVASGGVVNSATVTNGGTLSGQIGAIFRGAFTVEGVVSGGLLTGAGTVETVAANGEVHDQLVGSGATLTANGYISGVRVSGGTLTFNGSKTSYFGFTDGAGGTINLNASYVTDRPAGQALSGRTINVGSNGVLSNSLAGKGGVITVLNGGSAVNTTLDGGTINVYAPLGTTNTTFTSNGGTFNLQSGYTDSGARTWVVSNNVSMNVQSGALITKPTVNSGGKLSIASGGMLSGVASISSGGELSFGTIYAPPGSGNFPTINLQAGGIAIAQNGATILNGAQLNSEPGGILKGSFTVEGVVSGGLLTGAGTVETVAANGEVHDQLVGSGATLTANGYISGVRVSGGTLTFNGSKTSYFGFTDGAGGTINLNASYVTDRPAGQALSGRTINVGSNGVLSNSLAGKGGVITVLNGGSAVNTTLDGGTINVYAPLGTTNTTFTSNGGTFNLQSGYTDSGARTWVVSNNVSMNVQNGALITKPTVNSGGKLSIASGGMLSGVATVSSGGTLVLNGTAGTGAVNLSGDGAVLVIEGTVMPTNTISGWSPEDTIDLASIPRDSVKEVLTTASGITIRTKTGDYTLNVPGANTQGYKLLSDSNGGTVYTTCFAEGTRIATPGGESRVEDLAEGVLVLVPDGAMPIKWIGYRSITVADQREPEENWLIRIRAGALSDNIPTRDLLVTQEHCMVFDGKLVPARMLVNDVSIIIDRTIGAYTYYHVELNTHEAIWAEGALTESYLDTGNRDQFDNHTVPSLYLGRRKSGSSRLSLNTSRDFVEPIHAALVARTGHVPKAPVLTDRPDLHLVTELGEIIMPLRQKGDRIMFMIPPLTAGVWVRSRASQPSQAIGPYVDDRRVLGVLIGDISFFGAKGMSVIGDHLLYEDLAGWHGLELDAYRWTAGNAFLPLRVCSNDEYPGTLSIQIISSGLHRVASDCEEADMAL
ncbi:Hint domain-containing protein [Asaia sp. VD9]|uniref:Hint domain-containing protein n=1 Tax=Asaia sp. VD9 TaxID=3081235 RepID=UPI003019ED79